MIHVFASVRIKPACLDQALECYREFVPAVMLHEPGCIEYLPTVDVDMGLPNQETNDSLIVVVERWESVADFRRHLGMPHSAVFRERIGPLLAQKITVRVARSVL